MNVRGNLNFGWSTTISLMLTAVVFGILHGGEMTKRRPGVSRSACALLGVLTPWFLSSDIGEALIASVLVATILWGLSLLAVRKGLIPENGVRKPSTRKRQLTVGYAQLYLAYENTGWCDGAGAQLQRLLGIFSVSRLLGCKYIHTGLSRIGYQGLAVLESGCEIPGLVEMYNKLVQLPSDPPPTAGFGDHFVFVQSPKLVELLKLGERSMIDGRPILGLMHTPYAIADAFPGTYAAVSNVIERRHSSRFAHETFAHELNAAIPKQLVVAVHVRRGDLYAVDSSRMLDNQYYVAVCQQITNLLNEKGIAFRVDIYTEVPKSTFVVTGDSHGIPKGIDGTVEMSPRQLALGDFDAIEGAHYRINEHQVGTLFNLATADVLIGSRSSFSYVAAVAGTPKVVVMPRFWHALRDDWVESDPQTGSFDAERFVAALRSIGAR